MARFLEYLVKKAKILKWLMLALMVLLVLADILTPSGYERFFWEQIGGFGALYGLVSCVLIIVVSKALGYRFLYRPEDYYDRELQGREMSGDPGGEKGQPDE